MATYKKFEKDGSKVQVESAIRDGSGKNIENNYAKQDGAYENLWVGNLITDQNWSWVNDFDFGTGTVDTVFDGEATVRAIRGKTEWEGTTPHYVNVVSNKSVMFNLYNGTYAHVVESDEENGGLCIYGSGITVDSVLEFATDVNFSEDVQDITLTEETNSMGIIYLNAVVPSDGYLRLKNVSAPADFCIANVWGGNRVDYHPAYAEDVVTINTASKFGSGMKSITLNGEMVCYDEMYANRYYARCLAYSFGATPSVSYVNASGTYNIYRMSLSNALNKGYAEIGGSTKFAWTDLGQMNSSTAITANCYSLYTSYIYFAIAQSEDTSYTYSEDTAVVDAETFATQSALHTLYKLVDSDYVEATEYEEGVTYYYISATNLHGLNGKAITDEITNKVIVYQRYSMNKSTYTGTAISPALDWNYKMGDFGTEELTLAEGYPVVPDWVVYYPINVLETVQQLPNNYVSLESAENMLHQVGELQGFDFDSISVDEETGNMKVNGLVDTKETIVKNTTWKFVAGSNNATLTDIKRNRIYYNPYDDCMHFELNATLYTVDPNFCFRLNLPNEIYPLMLKQYGYDGTTPYMCEEAKGLRVFPRGTVIIDHSTVRELEFRYVFRYDPAYSWDIAVGISGSGTVQSKNIYIDCVLPLHSN